MKASADEENVISAKVIDSATPKAPLTFKFPSTYPLLTIWNSIESVPPLTALVASDTVKSPDIEAASRA